MTKGRVLILIVFAAVAGAALFWKMHSQNQNSVGAASRPRSHASKQDSVGATARSPVNDRERTPVGAASRPRTGPAAKMRPDATSLVYPSAGLERVASITNAADTGRLYERARAVRTIPTPLTQAEAEAFARYLLTPAPNAPNRDYENWLRNEMLDVMVQQPDLPQGFVDLLLAIYNDHKQDVVMRDYAVQHMVPAYELVPPEDQARLQAAMWQATTETDTSLAGTALLALLDVVDSQPALADVAATGRARPPGAPLTASTQLVDSVRLAQTALNLASSERCGELARISAVQVCGRMRVEQALPVVQRLAVEGPTMPLRIAATAALGDYAMDKARPPAVAAVDLLAQLADTSDAQQRLAAQAALRRLNRQQIR